MTCPVPATLTHGRTHVEVTRAWPTTRGTFRFEGRDAAGRVRAGSLSVGPEPGVSVLPYGTDRRLPDLAPLVGPGALVVHRAGKRAVVRRGEDYVKVVRPGGGPLLAEAAEHGRRRAVAAGLLAPEVRGCTAATLTMGTVPGVALHTAGQGTGQQEWRGWWRTWERCWPAVVTSDRTGLEVFTAAQEVAVLRAGVERALAWGALTDPTGGGARRTEQVAHALAAVDVPQVGVAHRDLHDKQLLAGPDGIGLLDFDTAALAEPALDLANLAVHARWRTAQGLWPRGQADVVVAAARRVADELEVPPERWSAYAAGTALRLAALYAFRPRWHALAEQWWQAQMRDLS